MKSRTFEILVSSENKKEIVFYNKNLFILEIQGFIDPKSYRIEIAYL